MNHIFEGCYYNEGIPVEVTVTVNIFVKVPIIFEGIPGRDNCSDDKQEQPQLGLAEGPKQPRELQQGPPSSREQPNKEPAEDLEQLKQLKQGVPQLHHWQPNRTKVPVKPL